jgi:hypothetical protein
MEPTARFYLCARCRRQVVICSSCDRGQRYCGGECAQAARQESLRAAGRRYQTSRRGRHRHAERQRRYRRRPGKKVTHQGSPAPAEHDSLATKPHRRPTLIRSGVMPTLGVLWCHFCARVCSGFVRLGFHRRRRGRRLICADP